MNEPTKYRCTQCQETDFDRAMYEPSPVALICFNCGAGRGMPPAQQAQKGVGMLPESHPVWYS